MFRSCARSGDISVNKTGKIPSLTQLQVVLAALTGILKGYLEREMAL